MNAKPGAANSIINLIQLPKQFGSKSNDKGAAYSCILPLSCQSSCWKTWFWGITLNETYSATFQYTNSYQNHKVLKETEKCFNGTVGRVFLIVRIRYDIRYVSSFIVLCFIAMNLLFLSDLFNLFTHISQCCFTGTGAIRGALCVSYYYFQQKSLHVLGQVSSFHTAISLLND